MFASPPKNGSAAKATVDEGFQEPDDGRRGFGALSTGTAQGALDESFKYAKDRQAFGTHREVQAIQFKLAKWR